MSWGLVAAGALTVGCTGSNVGDPCTPESVPPGGFQDTESYVETSSVQCRTRTCLVYFLQGNPNKPQGSEDCTEEDLNDGLCPTQTEIDERVFCSCRCEAPEGVDSPTCDCPSGFVCEELVTVEGAGQGVRGSYCVRDPNDPTMM